VQIQNKASQCAEELNQKITPVLDFMSGRRADTEGWGEANNLHFTIESQNVELFSPSSTYTFLKVEMH
jgi:hypothetical protein